MAKLKLWCATLATVILLSFNGADAIPVHAKLSEITGVPSGPGESAAAHVMEENKKEAEKGHKAAKPKPNEDGDASPSEMAKIGKSVDDLLGFMLRPDTASLPKITQWCK